MKERNEQLDAVKNSIVILAEYLLLVQKGTGIWSGDPNAQREIELLDQMLITLIPEKDERTEIINRLQKSIMK